MKGYRRQIAWLCLIVLLSLLAVACSGPPGEAVCRDFQRTITQRQAQELDLFEYTDRIVRLGDQAQAAEPEILQAATHLAYSITTVSRERVAVAIVAMRDACVKAGYLELGPLSSTDS